MGLEDQASVKRVADEHGCREHADARPDRRRRRSLLRGPVGRSPVGAPRVSRIRAGSPGPGAGRRLRDSGRAHGDEPRPRRHPCRPARGAASRRDDMKGQLEMNNRSGLSILVAVALLSLGGSAGQAQQSEMTFFVTSAGSGKGGDLGGLSGADRQCQLLAQAAGSGAKTWRAYLSTQGPGAVNARDRIGGGPWQNAKGVVIAKDVAELHGKNNISKQTALTEKGDMVNGRGDTPNMHDILTGSQPDGTAFAAGEDRTCGNWTKSGEGAAMVGHHERQGLRDDDASKSWNSSHPSRGPDGGCSQNDLKSTGGNGLFYCFATK